MKKLLIIILALAMCLSMTSCDMPEWAENVLPDFILDLLNPQPEVEYDLEKAASYLKNLYKDDNTTTAADYTVVSQVMIKGVKYDVTWESSNDKITIDPVEGDIGYLVNVDERSTTEESYNLTATITAGDGTTTQVVFEGRKVPVYAVASLEEYLAAKEGDVVTIEGIVTGMNGESLGNKRNHLFLVDASGNGGYYSYQMSEDPAAAGIKVGMTVSITGPCSPYSGMQEIKGGTFNIVDSTIKEVPAVDLTEVFTNATSETSFAAYVGMLATVKGVEIGSQELGGSSDYLYFTIGNLKSYVRTYITDMVAGASTEEKTAIKDQVDKTHGEKFGWTADVTGIVVLYSGKPYFIPVDANAFSNYTYVEKTPEEKVEAELGDIKFEEKLTSDVVLTLPTVGKYYEDVTLSYASNNAAVAIDGGKLTVTIPEAETEVVITVTATCGDVTKSVEHKIVLSKKIISIAEALEIAAAQGNNYTAGKYLVAGIITEIVKEEYGNLYIKDASGKTIYIYGLYSEDGSKQFGEWETKPAVGDYIVVLSIIGQYKDEPQLKSAWIVSFTTLTTIPDAVELGNTYEKNNYSEDKILVTGEITEVQNPQYGNVVIKDAEGNSILVYGLYSADGEVRYDKMTTKPAVGDTITVLGVVGKFNDAQLKNAWLVSHDVAATEGGDNEGGDNEGGDNEGGTTTPSASNKIELTTDVLDLGEYNADEVTKTVDGVGFAWIQLGNYGDGIQVRDKDGKTSSLWNTTAFSAPIARIELVYSSTKDVTHNNPDCAIYSFGNEVGNYTSTVKLSTVAGTKTYTITPDAETYTYFKFEHDLGYTQYWESITIVLVDGTVITQ